MTNYELAEKDYKAGMIKDDNCNEIIPIFLGYEVDKKNAGVKISILD